MSSLFSSLFSLLFSISLEDEMFICEVVVVVAVKDDGNDNVAAAGLR